MKITITVTTEAAGRIVDAVCGLHGYSDVLRGRPGAATPNPETRPLFTRRMIRQWLKRQVREWEGRQAGDAAREAAEQQAEDMAVDVT